MINETVTIINFNQTIIENLSYLSRDIKGIALKCEIDTMNVINQMDKLPKTSYYILLASLILITLYMFIPKLAIYIEPRDFLFINFLLILSSLFIYTFMTFNISSDTFRSKLEPLLYIIVGLGIIYILIKEKDNLRKIFNQVRKGD